MTGPARCPVDPVLDALDRLRQQINKSRATYVPGTPEKYPATELRGLTVLEAEALLAAFNNAEDAHDDTKQKLWRDRGLMLDLQQRAEAAEAEVRQLREKSERQATNIGALYRQRRAAQLEVERLTEGLRETKAALDRERGGGSPLTHKEYLALHERVRALLSASATDGHADTCATLLGAGTDPCSCGFVKPDGGGA